MMARADDIERLLQLEAERREKTAALHKLLHEPGSVTANAPRSSRLIYEIMQLDSAIQKLAESLK